MKIKVKAEHKNLFKDYVKLFESNVITISGYEASYFPEEGIDINFGQHESFMGLMNRNDVYMAIVYKVQAEIDKKQEALEKIRKEEEDKKALDIEIKKKKQELRELELQRDGFNKPKKTGYEITYKDGKTEKRELTEEEINEALSGATVNEYLRGLDRVFPMFKHRRGWYF
jgi:hypothetical protein